MVQRLASASHEASSASDGERDGFPWVKGLDTEYPWQDTIRNRAGKRENAKRELCELSLKMLRGYRAESRKREARKEAPQSSGKRAPAMASVLENVRTKPLRASCAVKRT